MLGEAPAGMGRRPEACEDTAMSDDLGPIDFDCDAPAYNVVRACERLGFVTPQDVRWRRLARRRVPSAGGLLGPDALADPCSCGQAGPRLESYTFTFLTGKQAVYLLGQCPRCHTIFWDKP